MPVLFDSETLSRARSLFPHLAQGAIYLNHAGTSPLSTRVVKAMTNYLQERSAGTIDNYPRDLEMVGELRSRLATLVNAPSASRIAFATNTSDAINVVASGIPWKHGDRILLNTIEFPANIYPWLNAKKRGVELDFIQGVDGRVSIDMIAKHLTPRTRLLAISAVQFLSGYRADLHAIGELCRSRGVILAVDAIQAIGAVCIDVAGMKIDALFAGAQKWQMGPHGSGFLYITEELQQRIDQQNLGWLSVHNPWSFYEYDQPLAESARRYEGGSLNMPSLWGLHASIGTILEFTPAAVERHILGLTGLLRDQLRGIPGVDVVTDFDDQERAGIVTIRIPPSSDVKAVFKKLLGRGVTVALRDGLLRYSPHFYCSPDDMERAAVLTREAL
jgi:selenocysteine lyase/cysteine desulfurase